MKKSLATALLCVAFLVPAATHAGELTGTQIRAILSVLWAFGAEPSVIANVRDALLGVTRSPYATTVNTDGINETSIVFLSPATEATVSRQEGTTISWPAIYGNAIYILTMTSVGSSPLVGTSTSVTAMQAGCTASIVCSYSWIPDSAVSPVTVSIRETRSERTGSVGPITIE